MNLLITGAWLNARKYIDEISKMGHNVSFLEDETGEPDVQYDWVDGIICNSFFLHHPIENFNNLKYIQLTSAGYDRVPMETVNERGISIYNARGVYSIPMAEYALSSVLSIYRKQVFFIKNQKEHNWEKERNIKELYGSKVCIVGCGSVGCECAIRFKAMGCAVFGVDPVVRENKNFFFIYNTDDIKEALNASDIVIITLPLTEQTRHLFSSKLLADIKDNAILVNIARGAVIDSNALVNELKTGRISAVLDVFEEEPLPADSELWDMENVIITPHNSFVGEGNGKRISDLIIKNLREF